MTQTGISNFLQAGAFFSGPDGNCRVWTQPRPVKGHLSSEFQLAFQSFFGTRAHPLSAEQTGMWSSREELQMQLKPFLASGVDLLGLGKASDFIDPQLADYQFAFTDIQNRIRAGTIKKAVPVMFARKDFRADGQGVSLSQKATWLYELLRSSQDGLYLYGFWGTAGGFIGATPEVLFWQRGARVQTMALAGTLPKSQMDLRLPLAQDPKELHEHQLVVEDILAQLKPLGFVQTGELETIELPTLFHLRTKIQLECRENPDPLELLGRLHPTPALGVAPREAGFDWLRQHPGQERRGVFGGPLLFRLGPDESIALVAIRNVQWDSEGLQVGSGGGVVEGSELQREWLELAQKREAVFKSLGMWDILS